MSASAAIAPTQILVRHRVALLAAIVTWQGRCGLARRLAPEEVLERCLGQLWLELDAGRDWRPALRRALYLEWELPARRAALPLAREPEARPTGAEPELPPWAQPWLQLLSSRDGDGLAPWRRLGWSRQRRRLVATGLARALAGRGFWVDLRRRCSRLFSRAALEAAAPGGGSPELRAEARLLLRLLAQLELPPGWRRIRRDLARLAAEAQS